MHNEQGQGQYLQQWAFFRFFALGNFFDVDWQDWSEVDYFSFPT